MNRYGSSGVNRRLSSNNYSGGSSSRVGSGRSSFSSRQSIPSPVSRNRDLEDRYDSRIPVGRPFTERADEEYGSGDEYSRYGESRSRSRYSDEDDHRRQKSRSRYDDDEDDEGDRRRKKSRSRYDDDEDDEDDHRRKKSRSRYDDDEDDEDDHRRKKSRSRYDDDEDDDDDDRKRKKSKKNKLGFFSLFKRKN